MTLHKKLSPYTHATCDDGSGCPARLDIEDAEAFWRRDADNLLARAGWTVFAGLRGHRTYCPDHGPRPGHKMRQVV